MHRKQERECPASAEIWASIINYVIIFCIFVGLAYDHLLFREVVWHWYGNPLWSSPLLLVSSICHEVCTCACQNTFSIHNFQLEEVILRYQFQLQQRLHPSQLITSSMCSCVHFLYKMSAVCRSLLCGYATPAKKLGVNVVVMEHCDFLFLIMNCKHWHTTNFMNWLLHLWTVNNW